MKLFEFLEDYQGFHWQGGETVIFDQRSGKKKICTVKEGANKDRAFFWRGLELSNEWNKPVWDWRHTEKTMLITL
jgi:hypothetical protein